MIQILLVSHGDYADGLLSAANMILGEFEGVESLSLRPDAGFEEFLGNVEEKLSEMDGAEGVLVLVDLYGGTPGNVSSIAERRNPQNRSRGVAGANLGMLLEAISSRDSMPLEELAVHCMDVGRDAIHSLEEAFEKS